MASRKEEERQKAEIANAQRIREAAEATAAAEKHSAELARERAEEAIRHSQRQRILVWALSFALLVALTVAWLWYRTQSRALASELAAQASLTLERDPSLIDRAALLALESMRRSPSLAGDQALRGALGLLPRELARLRHEHEVVDLTFSPDGSRLVTATHDAGTATITVFEWNIATQQVLASLSLQADRRSPFLKECRCMSMTG